MATKRTPVKEDDPTDVGKSTVTGVSNGIKSERSKRPMRKLKNLDENSSSIRWVLFVLVLSLAISCLIYYYNYYQPKTATPTTKTSNSNKNNMSGSGKNTKPDKTGQASKPTKAKPKETATKNESNKKTESEESMPKPDVLGKKKPSKSKKQSSSKYPKEKLGHLAVFPKKLRDRLLRLPIPPSDADRPLAMEIVSADDHLVQKEYSKALEKFNGILKRLPQSPRGLYGKAIALELIAEKRNNMKVLDSAIEHYRKVSIDSFLAPEIIKETCLIQLVTLLNKRERYDDALAACEKLCEMDPDNDGYAIQLGLTYVKAGMPVEAKDQLLSVLDKWPNSSIAKANLGFIYYSERDCASAIPYLMAGLEGDEGVKKNPRFYLYAGECLVKLNMYNESLDLYKVAVGNELFPSLWQRSLVTEKGLRAQPWWMVNETGLENEFAKIANERNTFLSELLPLVEEGKFTSSSSDTVWTLYSDGTRDEENCHVTTQSCDLIGNSTSINLESKVLLLPSSLHLPPHVSSTTNTRLRAILPLKLSGSLVIRVADDTRELEEGVLSVIDGSFEQELWHQCTSTSSERNSLLLIMEFWHHDLSNDRSIT